MEKSFIQAGVQVTGCCGFLSEAEMYLWLSQKKPDVIFEMNRVKDDIPILHDLGIPHITWIVDFQGRTESHIKGSDITYFFDPGWDENFNVGGLQDWLPPGTCTDTFSPSKIIRHFDSEFNFIGHIPKPWSNEELGRRMDLKSDVTFEVLLNYYERYLNDTKFEVKTHNDLGDIIKNICKKFSISESNIDAKIYYDLMERTKRVNNRVELLNLALKKSDSVAIYGSENWKEWPFYHRFYKHFIDCLDEMNAVHQTSKVNLHDGLSFHFRAIDCMASGGDVFWYDNNIHKFSRGLHDFFEDQWHFYTFCEDNLDEVYDRLNQNSQAKNKIKMDTISIIRSNHTWGHRVNKILNDIRSL